MQKRTAPTREHDFQGPGTRFELRYADPPPAILTAIYSAFACWVAFFLLFALCVVFRRVFKQMWESTANGSQNREGEEGKARILGWLARKMDPA